MKPIFYCILFAFAMLFSSCEYKGVSTMSDSGVVKAHVSIQTDVDGQTIEQKNYMERIRRDNLPGSIKHLYVISSMSGQVLIYSTVRGKVTSSGKRITPSTVIGDAATPNSRFYGNAIQIAGNTYFTNEVIGDDGTYGSSIEYLYWFDSKGVYHQHYRGANEMLHISDQPLGVKNVVLNLENL